MFISTSNNSGHSQRAISRLSDTSLLVCPRGFLLLLYAGATHLTGPGSDTVSGFKTAGSFSLP